MRICRTQIVAEPGRTIARHILVTTHGCTRSLPEWEHLLAAERHLQALLPDAVLVGGTAAAMPGGHRVSLDGDQDTVVLFERLGEDGVRSALATLDEVYPQDNGASVLAEVADQLGHAQPVDVGSVNLATHRQLVAPWNDWGYVVRLGRRWARIVADLALGTPPSSC